jgi:ribonuclease HI
MPEYEIGQKFVTCEEGRTSLVQIVGTRKNAQIQRVRFLSEAIGDSSALRELAQKTALELKIPWNLSFHHGKQVLACNLKKPPKPPQDGAVLGGDSKLKPGSLVLGGNNPPISQQLGNSLTPSNGHTESGETATAPAVNPGTGTKKRKLPTCQPSPDLKKYINKVNGQWVNHKTKFKDFLNLKSGRDEFSNLRGEKLLEKIPESIQEYVAEVLEPLEKDNNKFVEKIYRWWLRGLRCEAAVKKCRVDAEIAENAISSYQRRN